MTVEDVADDSAPWRMRRWGGGAELAPPSNLRHNSYFKSHHSYLKSSNSSRVHQSSKLLASTTSNLVPYSNLISR